MSPDLCVTQQWRSEGADLPGRQSGGGGKTGVKAAKMW